ncbi:unknown [Clostridium sp. CAG:967]|nr:unknown [Clostridium sp. CAG:967]
MRKNTKIIQISGLRGILMLVFVATCLAAGFIAFPAIAAMYAWNYAGNFIMLPVINIYQGLMLWAIIAISVYILNDRKKYLVAFKAPGELNDEEMKNLLERVKVQAQAKTLNSMVLKAGDIKPVEKIEKPEEVSENKKENV